MIAKSSFAIFVALLLAVTPSFFVVRHVAATDHNDVEVQEAAVMIDTRDLVILDVRNQSEYDTGHIRDAKLIPLWELATRLDELNRPDEILVYSETGERSRNASQILASNDFSHVYNMLGGTTEWIHQGYPVYVKYPSIQEAVNNASAGDTIRVSAGVYAELLTIDRPLTLEGENRHTTTIYAATNNTVNVSADNVSISDFTLHYSGGCACFTLAAMNVTGAFNVNVTNNVIVSDDYGIRVGYTRRLSIARNSFTCPNNTFLVVLNSSEVSLVENSIVAEDGMELENCLESIFSGNKILSVSGAGVFAYQCSQNIFSGNEITAEASTAISISNCYNNTFLGNNISSNTNYGLFFWESNNNSFFHNNFLENGGQLSSYQKSSALWDNGFEGNFWSHYTGVDADLDGIGDTPNVLDSMNRDSFPLTGMFHRFDTGLNYTVDVVSDSAIGELEYVEPDRTIRLRVSNTTENQTVGFCRMSIPHGLIDPHNDSISVIIDDGLTPVLFLNNTLSDNGTHRWIYFTYPHSTHEILVVSEFPMLLLPTLLMVTVVAAATCRRKRKAPCLVNRLSKI